MWKSAVFVFAVATLQIALAARADYRLTKTYGRNPHISLDIETGGSLWFWPDKKVHSLRIIAEIRGIRRPLPPKFNITETQTWHRITYKAKSHALHIRPGGIRHEPVFEEEYFNGLTFRHDSGTVYWMLLDSKENPGFTFERPAVKCPKFEATSERNINMVELPDNLVELPDKLIDAPDKFKESDPLNSEDAIEFLPIQKKTSKLTNAKPTVHSVVEQSPLLVEEDVDTTPPSEIDLFHTTTITSPVMYSPEHYMVPNDTDQQNSVVNQPFLGSKLDPDYPTLLGTDDDIPVSTWYQSIHGDGRHSGLSPRYQSLVGTDDDPTLFIKHFDAERGDIPLTLEVEEDYVPPNFQKGKVEKMNTTQYKNKNEMFPKGDGPGVSSKHQSPWGW